MMIANIHSFGFVVIFQAFVVLLVAVTQVGAGPLSVQRRSTLEVYVPGILEPTSSSKWSAGAQEWVRWNITNAPNNISNSGYVVLKTISTAPGGSQWRRLAGPFQLTAGQIKVNVPSDVISGKYAIVLFGDSSNESPAFQLNGGHPSDNNRG